VFILFQGDDEGDGNNVRFQDRENKLLLRQQVLQERHNHSQEPEEKITAAIPDMCADKNVQGAQAKSKPIK
jgi:hypothetical protein